ncbi:pksN [Symbiodinium microadriaticum]|nr:pksN [Symbiodinium microadriaticum]
MAARPQALRRAQQHGFGAFKTQQGIAILEQLLEVGAAGNVCAVQKTGLVKLDAFRVVSSGPRSMQPIEDVDSAISRVLQGLTDSAALTLDSDLSESGLDSLGAAELSIQLSNVLGIKLPATVSATAKSERELRRYVREELAAQRDVSEAGVPEATGSKLPILVVGAGVGGVAFAQQLVRASETVVVMEKGAAAGGSWTLGNLSSKLQIDAPSYMLNYDSPRAWGVTYPSKQKVLDEVREAANSLDLRLSHEVTSLSKVQPGEYRVKFTDASKKQHELTVGGVAFFLGGLHAANDVVYPGEDGFAGTIGLGHGDDVRPEAFKDQEVLIVGHGAFAIENMRTALQNGAKSVTIVARRRNIVFPSVVNWLINSVNGTLEIRKIRPVLEKFYQVAGITLDQLPALQGDSIDFRIPACSDIYFLAQAMGALRVVIGEVTRLESTCAVVDVFDEDGGTRVECLGFHRHDLVQKIFGRPVERKASFWLDGDPNLVANDQFQVPERVNSLLCPSYPFYVQAFAKAFLHYRKDPQALARLSFTPGVDINIMWEHFKERKVKVSDVTREQLPFCDFVRHRRTEWEENALILRERQDGANSLQPPDFDRLLRPAGAIVARLWPSAPQDFAGILAVPRRPRVLFFHGEKTNREVAMRLLQATGWWQQADLVVPDGPHAVSADEDPEQLERVGLTQLVHEGWYRPGETYKEWCANFGIFYDLHMGTRTRTPRGALNTQEAQMEHDRYEEAFAYLTKVAHNHGPFDAVAGFCQGAAFAHAAIFVQRAGKRDLGLGGVRMMIAMAPWKCPYHDDLGFFNTRLDMPLLLLHGSQDLQMFKDAVGPFRDSFASDCVTTQEFDGKHAYPSLSRSSKLQDVAEQFLDANR